MKPFWLCISVFMMFPFFIAALFSVNAHPACSCPPLGKIDSAQYNEYSLIVKGKVVSARIKGDKLFGERIIRLRVDKIYKGSIVEDTVSIVTPGKEGVCGIKPQKGESWLFFTIASNGFFKTDLCTRTKSMNPKAWDYNKEILEGDLKFLEQMKNSVFNTYKTLSSSQ